jgi:HlyD family secretion protein
MKSSPRPTRRIVLGAAVALVAVAAFFLLRRPGTLELTGIVTTDGAIVSSEVAGRLDQVLVREGDTVQAGQLLATLQAAEWQADIAFYEHSERQAAAVAAQAAADLRYQEALVTSQVRQAEANLESARAQAAAAAAEHEQARLEFNRSEGLSRVGAVTAQAHDEARNRLAAALGRRDAASTQAAATAAALESARAGSNQVESRRATLQAAKDLLAASAAEKDRARTRLARVELRAPIAGIVNVRAARAGEVVAVGQPVLTLVDPDDLWVRVDLEESLVERVRLGDRLEVRLPSGATRAGTLFFRAVEADYATQRDVSRTKRDIRTFQLRLRCDNADRALAVGLTAHVTVPAAPR